MAAWLKSVMSILMKHGGQSQPLDKGGLASEHSALEACVWSEARRDWLPSHWQHVKPQLIGQIASWVIIFVQHCQEHSTGVRPQGKRQLGLICLKMYTETSIYKTKLIKRHEMQCNAPQALEKWLVISVGAVLSYTCLGNPPYETHPVPFNKSQTKL